MPTIPSSRTTKAVAQQASAQLYAYANELAGQRRRDPRDIVTKLINAEIEVSSSRARVRHVHVAAAVAGNETARNATAWGMWALMQHPDQYAALCDDLDGRIGPAIEILRVGVAVYHFRRTAPPGRAPRP